MATEVIDLNESSDGYTIHDAKTHLPRSVRRRGRGSLRGQITLSPDWDTSAVNEAITDDFESDA